MWMIRLLPALALGGLMLHAAETAGPAANPADAFRDADYVQVGPGGKLHCNGKRVRYWGYIGFPLPSAVRVPRYVCPSP